jgi:predicted small lipoprotein YifL
MYIKIRHISLLSALALLATLMTLSACKQGANAPSADNRAPQQHSVLPSAPASASESTSAPSQAAGIAWTVPAGWEAEPARQMRIATYRIHAIAGDPEDAECAVYFFGTGQGGTVEANLDRWAHQFTSPDGQSQPAKIEKRVIAGLTVSTITASGTYLGAGGMMSQEQVKKPNFRMRGTIVEAPEGLVFFKFIGPLNTVAAAESDFNSLLGSVHRQ